MSLINSWVFDGLDAVNDVTYIGATVSNNNGLSTTTPNGTGKAWTNNGGGDATLTLPIDNQSGKTVNLKFDLNINNANIAYTAIFAVADSSGATQVRLTYDHTINKFKLLRGSTVIATGTVAVPLNIYNAIQIEIKVHTSTGIFKLFVNGATTADIDFSGNTQNQATDSFAKIFFGYDGSWAHGILVYGIIAANSDGTKNNGRISSKATYITQLPIADGASIWTPSTGTTAFNLLDDQVGAPNDTDTLDTSTLNARNICKLTALPADVNSVIGVTTNTRIAKVGVGVAGVKIGVGDGTDETQSAEISLPNGQANYTHNFEYLTGTTEFSTTNDLYISTELTLVV